MGSESDWCAVAERSGEGQDGDAASSAEPLSAGWHVGKDGAARTARRVDSEVTMRAAYQCARARAARVALIMVCQLPTRVRAWVVRRGRDEGSIGVGVAARRRRCRSMSDARAAVAHGGTAGGSCSTSTVRGPGDNGASRVS